MSAQCATTTLVCVSDLILPKIAQFVVTGSVVGLNSILAWDFLKSRVGLSIPYARRLSSSTFIDESCRSFLTHDERFQLHVLFGVRRKWMKNARPVRG